MQWWPMIWLANADSLDSREIFVWYFCQVFSKSSQSIFRNMRFHKFYNSANICFHKLKLLLFRFLVIPKFWCCRRIESTCIAQNKINVRSIHDTWKVKHKTCWKFTNIDQRTRIGTFNILTYVVKYKSIPRKNFCFLKIILKQLYTIVDLTCLNCIFKHINISKKWTSLIL